MTKETLVLGGILVASSCLFGYHGIHRHHEVQRQALQETLSTERMAEGAHQQVDAVVRRVERYRDRLAPTPEPSWLVKKVVELAETTGIQLTVIQQRPSERIHGFTRLEIQVAFTASYHELGTFLDEIERADAFIRVDRLGVGASTIDSAELGTSLVLSSYYVPPIHQL